MQGIKTPCLLLIGLVEEVEVSAIRKLNVGRERREILEVEYGDERERLLFPPWPCNAVREQGVTTQVRGSCLLRAPQPNGRSTELLQQRNAIGIDLVDAKVTRTSPQIIKDLVRAGHNLHPAPSDHPWPPIRSAARTFAIRRVPGAQNNASQGTREPLRIARALRPGGVVADSEPQNVTDRQALAAPTRVTTDILVTVSQTDRDNAVKAVDDLSAEERAWLEEQLATYRDVLTYLHDH